MQRVVERMSEAVATVPPQASVSEARQLCSLRGISHLVVVRDGGLMSRRPITVREMASVREAARLMRDNGVGCLPVVRQGQLIGIITPRDLSHAGLPTAEQPDVRECASCGSSDHVRAPAHEGCASFCLECIERSRADDGEAEAS